MASSYATNKKWRKENPEKRYKEKSLYYRRTRVGCKNKNKPWKPLERRLIAASWRPSDRVLGHFLGRSIQAIQVMRSKPTIHLRRAK